MEIKGQQQNMISSCSNLTSISNNQIVFLLNDVNCSSITISPLNVQNVTFYGQNNSILNLNLNPNTDNFGLFGNCVNLTIYEVNFKNCLVKSNSSNNVGIVVGKCANCNLTKITVSSLDFSFRSTVNGKKYH